ncbi:hypothetical protein ACFO1B_13640 [Dactylosporangium siamense]|uniref:hypothetical protein n=1 Tax=Dactylosporangium siamense TaxID=685454 RepID=UPI001943289B|nr:hypothetical protein [Dactylosporangium siamense]
MTVDAARPPRPAQVTVAFWLQLAGAALLLGFVGVAIAHAVHFDGAIDRAAALVPDADPGEVSDERTSNVVGTLFVGVPALLLAGWLAVTARPVLRGSNIARIFVFVAGGGQLLLAATQACGGFLLLPLAFAFSGDEDVIVDDGVSWEESGFQDALYNSSGLFTEVFFLSGFAVALLVLTLSGAVVLLLALPPASRYFVPRAAAPAWPAFPGGPMPYVICPDPSAHFPKPLSPAVPPPPPEEA